MEGIMKDKYDYIVFSVKEDERMKA